jgi:hypothetical protein
MLCIFYLPFKQTVYTDFGIPQIFLLYVLHISVPIPVAAQFKAWVCGRSLAGIVGSNPAGGMDVCLL